MSTTPTFGPSRWRSLLELGLTLLSAALLWKLAQPLGDPAIASGRNAIYANANLHHVAWLQSHVGMVLALWAITGSLVLVLARCALPATGFVCGAAALWLLAWGAVQQSMPGEVLWQVAGYNAWWLLAAGCVVLWPVLIRLAAALARLKGINLVRPPPQALRSVWLYPGFVVFSGLGLIWVIDYAARGPKSNHLLGWHQLQKWWWAVLLFTVVAGLRLPLLQAMTWVLSRVDSVHTPGAVQVSDSSIAARKWLRGKWLRWIVLSLGLGYVVAVVMYGIHNDGKAAALTNELVRTPSYLVGAWVVYRWLGASSGSTQTKKMPSKIWLRMAIVSFVVLLAFFILNDNGPLLVLTYTACLLLLALVWQERLPQLASWVSVLLSALAVWGLHTLLIQVVAPYNFNLKQRLQTLQVFLEIPVDKLLYEQLAIPMPVLASDFLARLHWFMQSAPWSGHGLGHTPWCGYAGQLGAACGNGVGVPRQIVSDYTFAALVGVWGAPMAILILLGLVLWLFRLLPQRWDAQYLVQQGSVNLDALGLWAVSLFAVTSLVQTTITVLGTLAVIPMTGITLPLLSYGGASLLVCAFFAGLGAHVAVPRQIA